MIRLRGVARSFGGLRVLAGVNLDVSRGDLVAIAGERGCGKTTLVHILSTLLSADSGTVEIEGLDSRSKASAVRKKIALADGWLAPGAELTTSEYLEFAASTGRGAGIRPVTRAGLDPARRIGTLNGEERARLSIACALESRRDVILIDAPLDACFEDRIREILGAGAAVVVTGAVRNARLLRLHGGRLETAPPIRRHEAACIA